MSDYYQLAVYCTSKEQAYDLMLCLDEIGYSWSGANVFSIDYWHGNPTYYYLHNSEDCTDDSCGDDMHSVSYSTDDGYAVEYEVPIITAKEYLSNIQSENEDIDEVKEQIAGFVQDVFNVSR